ncbi:MAG TPA: hypothetical protein DEQ61_14780 [Streptomyces sp.]|nr:hypothetical protein [Streptomyces sp.]
MQATGESFERALAALEGRTLPTADEGPEDENSRQDLRELGGVPVLYRPRHDVPVLPRPGHDVPPVAGYGRLRSVGCPRKAPDADADNGADAGQPALTRAAPRAPETGPGSPGRIRPELT